MEGKKNLPEKQYDPLKEGSKIIMSFDGLFRIQGNVAKYLSML